MVNISMRGECCIKVDAVQLLVKSPQVWDQGRASCKSVNPPRLGTNIAGIQYRFAVTLDEKHNSTGTMICIQKRDLNLALGAKLDIDCRLQGQRPKYMLQVLIGLPASFKHTLRKVDSVRVLLHL